MTHESDLRLALRLADMSDELSMALFRSEHRAHSRKADGSPVTEADTSIERTVRDELARERRDDHVHGEEFGGERTGHRVWLIDPIDGTASFAEGGDQWATLIALVEDGDPVVGVVSRPATSTRWWASRGGGAFRNSKRVHVSSTTRLADAVLADDFRSSAFRRLASNPVAAIGQECGAVQPWNDRFVFRAVAGGAVDIVVDWWAGSGPDLAGQVCIVSEAGGRFSDLDGRVEIDADVHIVSNGFLHDDVVGRVNDIVEGLRLDPTTRPAEDISAIRAARAEQPITPWSFEVS